MQNTEKLALEERIDLRKELLVCAEKYFNDTGVNTHCGICNAISQQANDEKYYDKMGKLLREIFQDTDEFLGDYTNTYEEWEERAYMCLFLAEYLQDTIDGPSSIKEETKNLDTNSANKQKSMKYTIAEILHNAADKHLAAVSSEYWARGGNKEKFSCCAVEESVIDLHRTFSTDEIDEMVDRISYGLKKMGCPTDSCDAFNDSGEFKTENQQARYAWLKFAAIIAEEQGV